MSVPVVDDVVDGAARHLLGLADVTAVVGRTADGWPLIVQDDAPPLTEIGDQVCVVLALAGTIGGNDHNTYQQARLLVELWSGPPVDAGGNVVEPSAARRAMSTVYGIVDRHLHRPQGGAQRWGALLTTDCTRLAGLTPYEVPAAGGFWRGTAYYAVGLG